MSRVIIFSRYFPSYHPEAGKETYFPEKIMAGLADILPDYKIPDEMVLWEWYTYYNCEYPKWHTIRAGNRWKVGDKFSPRIWSGKPYKSKQIIIGPDIEVKKIWEVEIVSINEYVHVTVPCRDEKLKPHGYRTMIPVGDVAMNDGLSFRDFKHWFSPPSPKGQILFEGQIICWNESIKY